jgi:hypothetical protein
MSLPAILAPKVAIRNRSLSELMRTEGRNLLKYPDIQLFIRQSLSIASAMNRCLSLSAIEPPVGLPTSAGARSTPETG